MKAGRPRTTSAGLPPGIVARKSGDRTLYYLRDGARKVALGEHLATALATAEQLRAAPPLKLKGRRQPLLPIGVTAKRSGFAVEVGALQYDLGCDRPKAFALAAQVRDSLQLDRLLTPEEIAGAAQVNRAWAGVYFLLAAGEVIYVGSTSDLRQRLSQHQVNGVEFDAWHFVPCELGREDLERRYIAALRPRLNIKHNL
jgi:hypothetical protein